VDITVLRARARAFSARYTYLLGVFIIPATGIFIVTQRVETDRLAARCDGFRHAPTVASCRDRMQLWETRYFDERIVSLSSRSCSPVRNGEERHAPSQYGSKYGVYIMVQNRCRFTVILAQIPREAPLRTRSEEVGFFSLSLRCERYRSSPDRLTLMNVLRRDLLPVHVSIEIKDSLCNLDLKQSCD